MVLCGSEHLQSETTGIGCERTVLAIADHLYQYSSVVVLELSIQLSIKDVRNQAIISSEIVDVKALINTSTCLFSALGWQDDEINLPKLLPYVLNSSPFARESAFRCLAILGKIRIDTPVANYYAWVDDGVAHFRLFLLEALTQIIEQKDSDARGVLAPCLETNGITELVDLDSMAALNLVRARAVKAPKIPTKENNHAILALSAPLTDGHLQVRQSAEKAFLQRQETDCQRTVLAVAEHLDHQYSSAGVLELRILLRIADVRNQAIIFTVEGLLKERNS